MGGATPAWGGATPKPSSWNESSSAPADNGWVSPAPPTSEQIAPTPAFGAPTPVSAPTPGGPGYGTMIYNAQTPAGMFTSRSDMPAETPAAYLPHERYVLIHVLSRTTTRCTMTSPMIKYTCLDW
jgi:hypothetical protein